MTHTPNLTLPQWDKTDRIMMDDFNTAFANIDSAVTERTKGVELPFTVSGLGGSTLRVTLDDINWDDWSIVIVTHDTSLGSGTLLANVVLDGSDQYVYNSCRAETLYGPSATVFLPLRDSSRALQALYLGAGGGYIWSSAPFRDVTGVSYSWNGGTFVGTVSVRAIGIR